MTKKAKQQIDSAEEDQKFPLPEYSAKDDIYNRAKEEPLDDEDQPAKGKLQAVDKKLGDDLDIPGSELDDADEALGEEDEENNYYSLGGDNHDDLEESQE
jgi:hypothetical protein